jgi:O-antigen/teichoic acid export membrane protein
MNSGNKRIAYNTFVLYIKLVLSVVIGLYASRLTLQALGNSDYGLYSVVGGIVTLLNVLGVTMVNTSYRFIGVEIGKAEKGNANRIYNAVLVVHIVLAISILILGASVGLWYVNNYLNVEPGKISDAQYVLIISVFTTAISVIGVPSNGLMMARERFVAISCVEIAQLIIRILLIIFILVPYEGNRLRLYANLLAIVKLIGPVTYSLYCLLHDGQVCKWKFNRCVHDYKKILIFAGWMSVSVVSFMGLNQGITIILNIFFGTVTNAAFGIANQIQSYLAIAPKNLLQASSPQIIQNYVGHNPQRALSLTYSNTRYCFFILFTLAIPFLIFIDEILSLWLGEFPPDTDIFAFYMIISIVIGALTNGFDSLIMASGKIRHFQLNYMFVNLSILPVAYFLFSEGFPAYTYAVLLVVFTFLSVITQIWIVAKETMLSLRDYFMHTLKPAVLVVICDLPLFVVRKYIVLSSFGDFFLCLCLIVLWESTVLYFVGLNIEERIIIKQTFSNKILRR